MNKKNILVKQRKKILLALLALLFLPAISSSVPNFGYDYSEYGDVVIEGGNYTINVSNSEHFDGYSVTSLYNYFKSFFDDLYVDESGDVMSGDIDMDGNDIISVGNVGIGTASPEKTLDVSGTLAVSGTSYLDEIWAFDDGGNNRILTGDSSASGQFGGMRWNSITDELAMGHSSVSNMESIVMQADGDVVMTNGKVGIGTATPAESLEVVGNIRIPSSSRINTASGSALGYMGGSEWGVYTGSSDYSLELYDGSAIEQVHKVENTDGHSNWYSEVTDGTPVWNIQNDEGTTHADSNPDTLLRLRKTFSGSASDKDSAVDFNVSRHITGGDNRPRTTFDIILTGTDGNTYDQSIPNMHLLRLKTDPEEAYIYGDLVVAGDALVKTLDFNGVGGGTGITLNNQNIAELNKITLNDNGNLEGYMGPANAWGLDHPETASGGYDAIRIIIDDPFTIKDDSNGRILNLSETGNLNVEGSVTADYFIGNGSQLTGLNYGDASYNFGANNFNGSGNFTGSVGTFNKLKSDDALNLSNGGLIAFGPNAESTYNNNIAIGSGTKAKIGNGITVVGINLIGNATGVTLIGNGGKGTDNYCSSVGYNSNCGGLKAISISSDGDASDDYAIYIGISGQASGLASLGAGNGADAIDDQDMAIGKDTYTDAGGGSSVGNRVTTTGALGQSFGYSFTNNLANTVAFGFSKIQQTINSSTIAFWRTSNTSTPDTSVLVVSGSGEGSSVDGNYEFAEEGLYYNSDDDTYLVDDGDYGGFICDSSFSTFYYETSNADITTGWSVLDGASPAPTVAYSETITYFQEPNVLITDTSITLPNIIKARDSGNITFYNSTGGYANLNAKSYGVFSPKDIDYNSDKLSSLSKPNKILDEEGKLYPENSFSNEVTLIEVDDLDKPIYKKIYYEECDSYVDENGTLKESCTTKSEDIIVDYEKKKENRLDLSQVLFNNRLMLSELGGNLKLHDNLTEFDTSIMAENIYTQSKVINLDENYALKFLDATALSDKATHKNKVEVELHEGDTEEVLDMEGRVVDIEGAFSNHMTCMYNHKKYEDYRDCMLDLGGSK